jgi:hypothetical protein
MLQQLVQYGSFPSQSVRYATYERCVRTVLKPVTPLFASKTLLTNFSHECKPFPPPPPPISEVYQLTKYNSRTSFTIHFFTRQYDRKSAVSGGPKGSVNDRTKIRCTTSFCVHAVVVKFTTGFHLIIFHGRTQVKCH